MGWNTQFIVMEQSPKQPLPKDEWGGQEFRAYPESNDIHKIPAPTRRFWLFRDRLAWSSKPFRELHSTPAQLAFRIRFRGGTRPRLQTKVEAPERKLRRSQDNSAI